MKPLGWGVAGDSPDVRAFLLPELARSDAARVVAVYDPDPAVRAAVGALAPDAAQPADPGSFLDADGVEAVRVTAVLAGRGTLVQAAGTRGIAFLGEPPLGRSAAAAAALLERFASAGTLVATDFLPRWHPAHLVASDEIEGGLVGTVIEFRVTEFRVTDQTTDGALPTLLRGADLVGMLLGDDLVEAVVADDMSLLGTTRRGVRVSLAHLPGDPAGSTVEVTGGTGRLTAVGTLGAAAGGTLTYLPADGEPARQVDFPPDLSPVTVQVERFSRAVRGAGPWGYSLGRDLRLFRLVESALAAGGSS